MPLLRLFSGEAVTPEERGDGHVPRCRTVHAPKDCPCLVPRERNLSKINTTYGGRCVSAKNLVPTTDFLYGVPSWYLRTEGCGIAYTGSCLKNLTLYARNSLQPRHRGQRFVEVAFVFFLKPLAQRLLSSLIMERTNLSWFDLG